MTDLETAFYIMGIVFMSIMLVLVIALVVAVFVIRSKIVKMQRQIEERIDAVTDIAGKTGEIVAKVGVGAARTIRGAKRKISK